MSEAGLFVLFPRVKHSFRALGSRNYRRFFFANSFSLIGTWMQKTAMGWLVYRLTGSPLALGITEFANQFSAFLLMPLAGVFLDHFSLKRTILLTQILATIQALLLGLLTLYGNVEFWHVVLLSVFLGLTNAFDMPGRHSLVSSLVEKKEDLVNAIALNSSLFNSARLIGPSIAGVAINLVGEGFCFLLNALSFLPVIGVLATLSLREEHAPRKAAVLHEMKEGLTYASRHGKIGPTLFLLSFASLIGMSYMVLMPVVAKDTLQGGPDTLGFLLSSMGVGALAAALTLAARRNLSGLEEIIPLSFGLFGIGLALFAFSTNIWLSVVLMVFNGYCMVSGWSAGNTVLQTAVDDDKRGRVMSLYMMSFVGMTPIGSLVLGFLAKQIGTTWALAIFGLLTALGSLVFFLCRRSSRYARAVSVEATGLRSSDATLDEVGDVTPAIQGGSR